MELLGIYFNMQYILLVAIPTLLLMGFAQLLVKSAYSKYSKIPNQQGITGAEAAELLLRNAGIHDVRVEQHQGWLNDHYSPREKVVRLSHDNYSGHSIAAVGIAAHEVGHAIQHANKYAPLVLRNMAVPMANLGSSLGWIVIMIGAFIGGLHPNNPIALAGLALIACVALFQLINLPVEFDASRRALQVLPETSILSVEEAKGARAVLSAAALTYLAATLTAIVQLLYWASRLGLIGGSRR